MQRGVLSCANETGVHGWRRLEVDFRCPLVSSTVGRRKVTNRRTKHSHLKCRVVTPSSASIHSRPFGKTLPSPLSTLHLSQGCCCCISLPISPLIFCFCSWLLISPFPFTLCSLPSRFLSPSSSLFLLQTPVFVHMPPRVCAVTHNTHSSTSVWSRWHLQISM